MYQTYHVTCKIALNCSKFFVSKLILTKFKIGFLKEACYIRSGGLDKENTKILGTCFFLQKECSIEENLFEKIFLMNLYKVLKKLTEPYPQSVK